MTNAELLKDYKSFITPDNKTHYFVKLIDDAIRCWRDDGYSAYDGNKLALCNVPVTELSENVLTSLGIWDDISKVTQKQILGEAEEVKKQNDEKMAHARKGRKPRANSIKVLYADYPEFMECECGNKVKANYHYLHKKAEKLGKTVQDLIDEYKCQTCNPTKGRRKKNA